MGQLEPARGNEGAAKDGKAQRFGIAEHDPAPADLHRQLKIGRRQQFEHAQRSNQQVLNAWRQGQGGKVELGFDFAAQALCVGVDEFEQLEPGAHRIGYRLHRLEAGADHACPGQRQLRRQLL